MSISRLVFGTICSIAAVAVAGGALAVEPNEDNDARAKRFLACYDAAIRPLIIEVERCHWDAGISGKPADFQKTEEAQTRLDRQLSDPKVFAELQAIKAGHIADRLVARQIALVYLQYLEKQVDPELLQQISAKATAVEQAFNVYRACVKGKELSGNDVKDVLRHSKDSVERRAVWEASKGVGQKVEAELKAVVKLRNQAARKLGYADYHALQLALNEQDQAQMVKLFDELDALTRAPFRAAKAEIDAGLAKDCGIKVGELRPWHYHDPFFQEPPEVAAADEAVYAKVDILKTLREFYAGIGLPVDDVLRRSDLYEKPGKNPHALCVDLDNNGDVRVLANIVPNKEWLATMLHELGHAVYSSKNIPPTLPYVLRSNSHILTTEGIAMMFDRFAENADWLEAMGIKVPNAEEFGARGRKLTRNRQLIFSRWCQVMFRFEKELYGNPDQDLNRLWWDLVEKYQELRRPEGRSAPDYAAKIHFVLSPAYYHNYQLGDMFASQVQHALVREVLKRNDPLRAAYAGNKAAGEFLKRRVFEPGRTLDWNELTRYATGEDLSPKAFAEDIGNK